MSVQIVPVEFDAIVKHRDLYRQEMNCQIVHDSAFYREGCVQCYRISDGGAMLGYGAVWIGPYWMAKGSVFEYYVLPPHRNRLVDLFRELLTVMKPSEIHTQTSDPFLSVLIYEYVKSVEVGHILFREGSTTHHAVEGVVFRQSTGEDKDRIFEHRREPVGDWVLETGGRIVATGGVLYHYNRPYGDIYMEVDEPFRSRGYGRYLVQELKRITYEGGSIPAARCQPDNTASRRTLEGAGFVACGRLIHGETTPAVISEPPIVADE